MDDRSWLMLTVFLGVVAIAGYIWALAQTYRIASNESRFKRMVAKLTGREPEQVSEEEIMQMVDAGEETGVIQQEEREMIENIFQFDSTTAADVMVHRTDMVLLNVEDTAQEILQTIESSGLSRFPVYENEPDDIIGILNVREYLLNTQCPQPKALRELLRQPYFVPETVRTDRLFRDMQDKKVHMAIVVDEYGGTAGLVTMEDLLEEIVGNISDEFDPAEESGIIQLAEDRWRVAGGVELEELDEALGLALSGDEDGLCVTIRIKAIKKQV